MRLFPQKRSRTPESNGWACDTCGTRRISRRSHHAPIGASQSLTGGFLVLRDKNYGRDHIRQPKIHSTSGDTKRYKSNGRSQLKALTFSERVHLMGNAEGMAKDDQVLMARSVC